MMINGTVVEHMSRTQATTAEAEYYAVITGAAEALGNAVDDDGLVSVSGRIPTQPRRLREEDGLGRPDM